MIAALPMYDRPETRAATDGFWAGVRAGLVARGIDAPETLTRDRDPWDVWQAPDLVLAQACGLPYRAALAAACDALAPADRAALNLRGIFARVPGDYTALPIPRAPGDTPV